MSYANMDHAEWVASNNAAENRLNAKRRKAPPLLPEVLTLFQSKVADIVGMVFGGAYNAPINWEKVNWRYGGSGVYVPLNHLGSGLATWDFNRLTMLVFLCHEARIRCELGAIHRSVSLAFWQRAATGAIHERHPSIDEAVTAFRDYVKSEHRIYHVDTPAEAAA